jgi:hypothetical protein
LKKIIDDKETKNGTDSTNSKVSVDPKKEETGNHGYFTITGALQTLGILPQEEVVDEEEHFFDLQAATPAHLPFPRRRHVGDAQPTRSSHYSE